MCLALSVYALSGTSHYCDWVGVSDRAGGHMHFLLEESHYEILNIFDQVALINI